jgi:GntP family gluconate:H+ symporter
MPVEKFVTSFTTGFGTTAGNVGLLIALGAMLGKLLSESGGADQIVDTIVGRTSPRMLPWAMALIAAIIGLPMFFEIGLVILIPVVLLVHKRSGVPLLKLGIPALAGLSVMHGLVPPHPGPLAAIGILKSDVGTTMLLGIVVAIPTVIIAGPLFGKVVTRWMPDLTAPEHLIPARSAEDAESTRRPAFGITVATVLLPVVLMLGKFFADLLIKDKASQLKHALDFIGNPPVALLLSVVVAMFALGRPAGFGRKEISATIGDALPPIAGILLIVAAGGGFKQTLIDAGVGDMIKQLANGSTASVLILGWAVAVAIRVATGSATVATVSAAGIVAPLAAGLTPTHAALLTLAVGAGSLFFSHVNDAGFWLVKEYFGMSVGQTIRSWSVMETIISVVALLGILLLGVVV